MQRSLCCWSVSDSPLKWCLFLQLSARPFGSAFPGIASGTWTNLNVSCRCFYSLSLLSSSVPLHKVFWFVVTLWTKDAAMIVFTTAWSAAAEGVQSSFPLLYTRDFRLCLWVLSTALLSLFSASIWWTSHSQSFWHNCLRETFKWIQKNKRLLWV